MYFLQYEKTSWIPAYAGMTTRDKGGKTTQEINGKTNFGIGQPDYEIRDMPVLNRCFIRKAFCEMDYFGQIRPKSNDQTTNPGQQKQGKET